MPDNASSNGSDFRSARRQRATLIDPSKVDEMPPHSIEAEQGVLGCCLLASGDCLAHVAESLPPEAFYDLRHRTIFGTLNDLRERGEAIDIITVQNALRARRMLEDVGGLSYLASLPDATPSAANLDHYLAIVIEKFTVRQAGSISIEAVNQLREFPDRAATILTNLQESVAELRRRLPGAQEAALTARMFRREVRPPEAAPVYLLSDVAICTPGNLTTISAAVKSGKSAVVGAMLAAVFANDDADTFSITSSNPLGKAVVHLDTEQSVSDHWHLVDRALRRAAQDCPPWLLSYCMTGEPHHRIQHLLHTILAGAAQKFRGIHSVVIDGVADLVADVNDPAECNAFVASLHAAAIQYDCPIVGVIHLNPGSEKVRGHLGSQLERKAETNLMLEKDGEIVCIYSTKQRRAPVPKDTGPRFRWDDNAQMHVSCSLDALPSVSAKRAALMHELADVFRDRPSMRYGEMVATVKTTLTVSQRTAERKVAAYRQHRLIEESVSNLWVRATC